MKSSAKDIAAEKTRKCFWDMLSRIVSVLTITITTLLACFGWVISSNLPQKTELRLCVGPLVPGSQIEVTCRFDELLSEVNSENQDLYFAFSRAMSADSHWEKWKESDLRIVAEIQRNEEALKDMNLDLGFRPEMAEVTTWIRRNVKSWNYHWEGWRKVYDVRLHDGFQEEWLDTDEFFY